MSGAPSTCGSCRFAVPYEMPDPLPVPTQHSVLFGLIRWDDGPDWIDEALHAEKTYRARNCIYCTRFPKGVKKHREDTCGEFAEASE